MKALEGGFPKLLLHLSVLYQEACELQAKMTTIKSAKGEAMYCAKVVSIVGLQLSTTTLCPFSTWWPSVSA